MPNRVHELSSGVVTILAIIVSCIMAGVLIKAPHNFLAYLTILTPYIFLFGVWNNYQSLSGALDATNSADLTDGVASISLRDRAGIVATFGLAGISVALTAGFVLGHMSAH